MKKIIQYVHEAKEELKKVTWPDRDEVTSFTGVVVLTVVILAIFLWIVDNGLAVLIGHATR